MKYYYYRADLGDPWYKVPASHCNVTYDRDGNPDKLTMPFEDSVYEFVSGWYYDDSLNKFTLTSYCFSLEKPEYGIIQK